MVENTSAAGSWPHSRRPERHGADGVAGQGHDELDGVLAAGEQGAKPFPGEGHDLLHGLGATLRATQHAETDAGVLDDTRQDLQKHGLRVVVGRAGSAEGGGQGAHGRTSRDRPSPAGDGHGGPPPHHAEARTKAGAAGRRCQPEAAQPSIARCPRQHAGRPWWRTRQSARTGTRTQDAAAQELGHQPAVGRVGGGRWCAGACGGQQTLKARARRRPPRVHSRSRTAQYSSGSTQTPACGQGTSGWRRCRRVNRSCALPSRKQLFWEFRARIAWGFLQADAKT